jgi:hypothetical protein
VVVKQNPHEIHDSPPINPQFIHLMPHRGRIDGDRIIRTSIETDEPDCSSRNQFWKIGSKTDDTEKREEHYHNSIQHKLLSRRQDIRRKGDLVLIIHEFNLPH